MGSLEDALTLLSTESEDLYVPSVIKRISKPTPLQFYRDYVSKNVPVIITGGIDHWPAFSKWTDEYLTDTMKDKIMPIAVTPNGRADAVTDMNGKEYFMLPEDRDMTMGEFLKLLHNQQVDETSLVYYLQQQNNNFRVRFEELKDDVDPDISWATEAFGKDPDAVNLWIGSDASVSSMHKDPYENLYGVVAGEKIFTLIPPTDLHCLHMTKYPVARYKQQADTGVFDVLPEDPAFEIPWVPVDPQCPDIKQYPNFRDAHVLTAVVKKGELLYLPALWFHQVSQRVDDTGRVLAVNYWYDMDYDLKYVYYKFMESLILEPVQDSDEDVNDDDRSNDGWGLEDEESLDVEDCPCCMGGMNGSEHNH